MKRIFCLCFLIFCLLCVMELTAQKKIYGRSEPVRFSLIMSPDGSVSSRKSLREHYMSSFQSANLDSLPSPVSIRPYSVAVIIGVERYNYIPVAPYSARDAALMSRYFKALLGVDRVILHTDSEVSGFFFDNLFDESEGELLRIVEKGKTDLYVYYSGHGIPSANGEDLYMLPVDCKMNLLERQGYSLNRLFQQLSKLPTRSTTVFIDACFSGLGKFSQSGSPANLTRTKGVKVKSLLTQPWLNNPSFNVFVSSAGSQPSLVLDESRTGLFTYYLTIGLRGEADLNQDGEITCAELYKFLYGNITENSIKIYQEQTPCFYGNESFILSGN